MGEFSIVGELSLQVDFFFWWISTKINIYIFFILEKNYIRPEALKIFMNILTHILTINQNETRRKQRKHCFCSAERAPLQRMDEPSRSVWEPGSSLATQIPFKWHCMLAPSKPLPYWQHKAYVNETKLTGEAPQWGQKCGWDFLQHQRSVEASTSEAKAPGQRAAIHSAAVISAGFWPGVRG